jgi:hypothetical protein
MPRTICDLGDAHIRLQAPDHWMQVEERGSRVVLRDAGCSTPIFLEPLPAVAAVDPWIAALVTRKTGIRGHQECSTPDARRFVLTITGSEGTVERAYHLQCVPSSRSTLVWVAASIDLDGDPSRARLLAQVFPGVTQVPNVADGSGLRQYIEADGYTVKLPRGYSVAEAEELRFQLREGTAMFGWLTCRHVDAAATATLDELQRRGAIVQPMAGTSRLVLVPAGGDEVHDCALWMEAGERGHVVFSLEKSGSRDLMLGFFRPLARELRPWTAPFHGYWTPPHSLEWRDFTPAPPPAPKPPPAPAPPPRPAVSPSTPDLRGEWKERLSGAMLHYKSGPSGSSPRGFYGGGREVTIHLLRDGTVTWEESGFVSTTLPNMYMADRYEKQQSGTWLVQADASAWLVLHLSKDGRQRLPLGRIGDKVTLDGTPYSLIKV